MLRLPNLASVRRELRSNNADLNRYMVYHQNLSAGGAHSHFVEIFPRQGDIVGFTQVALIGDLGKVSSKPWIVRVRTEPALCYCTRPCGWCWGLWDAALSLTRFLGIWAMFNGSWGENMTSGWYGLRVICVSRNPAFWTCML